MAKPSLYDPIGAHPLSIVTVIAKLTNLEASHLT